MDWISRLNNAINYLEEHIEDKIDMEKPTAPPMIFKECLHIRQLFLFLNIFTEAECH